MPITCGSTVSWSTLLTTLMIRKSHNNFLHLTGISLRYIPAGEKHVGPMMTSHQETYGIVFIVIVKSI